MKPADLVLGNSLRKKLISFNKIRELVGIQNPAEMECLIEQMIDSVRRIKYVEVINSKNLSPTCADPSSIAFDPIKGASILLKRGDINEAFWLVFLSIHFGKNLTTQWALVRDVYSGLSNEVYWNWERTSNNPLEFKKWLNANIDALKENGKFGNHRKYQSLKAYSPTGTGATITSYIDWIGRSHNHSEKIQEIYTVAGEDKRKRFKVFYNSMNDVIGFGRTAKFDYLTMLGKLNLADIEPDSTYMDGATGPFAGANLLFGTKENSKTLNIWLAELETHLGLYYGMQVLEDSLCNWQKSPTRYIHFVG